MKTEAQKEANRRDHQKHRPARLLKMKDWARSHPDYRSEASATWYQRNPVRHAENGKKHRKSLREKVFDLLGRACKRCGFSDLRALQVDHVFGAKEPRGSRIRSGSGLYGAILAGKIPLSDVQPLCANCNWIKRAELNENRKVRKEAA